MLPWYHGTMVPWYRGTMVPWLHDTMVKWLHGTKVPWSRATMMSWYGTMVIAMACRCLDVWGAACRCLGRGVPMSGARRADVCASWGHQLVPAGAKLVSASSSWYQLVPAGTGWYQVGTSGYQLVPPRLADIGTPCPRHRHAAPQTSARRAPDVQASTHHGSHHGTIP